MDPSKFSVRVTKPTMVRHEKFGNSTNSEIEDMNRDERFHDRYETFTTGSASWCAPRRARHVDSSASMGDDSSDKEFSTKNSIARNRAIGRWSRNAQRKRIEELSRPKVAARRVPRSHEIPSKIRPNVEKDFESIGNSTSDVALKSSNAIEKSSRDRRSTDRIARLAEPKIHRPIAINHLGKVDERALFAVASKRIEKLAMPKRFAKLEIDPNEKPDPFGVNPQALRAICSPRIEVLSRPKNLTSSSASGDPIIAGN